MEEVIEDIISMQSSYDDLQNYPDPVVQMPNTVSKIWGGIFSYTFESYTSLSCPFVKISNANE